MKMLTVIGLSATLASGYGYPMGRRPVEKRFFSTGLTCNTPTRKRTVG
jgi:hypothetical protein